MVVHAHAPERPRYRHNAGHPDPNNIELAKSKKNCRVFFLGANSDAYDMRLMQYTLARHSEAGEEVNGTEWFDMLSRLGVVGTIDITRLIPSFVIFDGLKGRSGKL